MSEEYISTKNGTEHDIPYYVPYRKEQTTREERLAHVIGRDYKILQVGSDRHAQEFFKYIGKYGTFFL